MRTRSQTICRLDYCQTLLVSQINDTLMNFAEYSEQLRLRGSYGRIFNFRDLLVIIPFAVAGHPVGSTATKGRSQFIDFTSARGY
jgi:hypothetical protein